MKNNTRINRMACRKVALALEELNEKVVFVGGAVISLYADDPAAEDVRPTKDIDISFEVTSPAGLEFLREQLEQKGFSQTFEDDVICRFRYEDLKVDVLSTQAVGWAPSNIWITKGFDKAIPYQLDEIEIRLLPFPFFLASKFSAFQDRGARDPRTSHDFEDIVYLLNYSLHPAKQILSGDKDVRKYLAQAFEGIQQNDLMQEAVMGHLYYEQRQERFARIMKEMREVIEGEG